MTNNYYPRDVEMYIIFCLLAGAGCSALYWYWSANINNTNLVNNIPIPHPHYQKSHWSDELEKKLETLSVNTESGYPIEIAITGSPGSGKTDLVKYYAHKHATKSSLVWSIGSDTSENLWRNYRLLADELKLGDTSRLPGEDDQGWHARICHKVNQSLSKRPGWILIFDNVEKLEEIIQFLPRVGNQKGKIIITTRDANLLDAEHSIDISSGMYPTEATQLLQKITKLPSNEDAEFLAANLEYLPLYILISAATIRNRNVRNPETPWSYASYNARLQELSSELIETEHGLNVEHFVYKKTQHAAIRDAIKQLSAESQAVLVFCSHISSTGISRALLEDFFRVQNNKLPDNEISIKCEKILREIQRSSLLQQIPGQSAYSIHRITQKIGRQYSITSQEYANSILGTVLLKLPPFDDIDYDIESKNSIATWRPILPHLLELITHRHLLEFSSKDQIAKFFYYVSRLQEILGNHQQSILYILQVLPIVEDYYGKESWQVAIFLNVLGESYVNLGKYEPARTILENSLLIAKNHYGDRSWQSATFLNILGLAYINSGEYLKTEELLREALPVLEDHYGSEHYQVAKSLNMLGFAYAELGKFKEVKDVLERALPIRETYYGHDHWQVATVLSNLGFAYIHLGNPKHAKDLLERALPIRESHYGPHHWHVTVILNYLGLAYIHLGNAKYAKELLERALLIRKEYFGYDHWRVAAILNTLGLANIHLGEYRLAKEQLEHALPIRERRYGHNHWQVEETLKSLSMANEALEKLKRLGVE